MKNTIITSRSVEGATGLKQIWGLGREEHYGCSKNRTVSPARRLAQQTPALSPKVHTYTNSLSTAHADPQKHAWATRCSQVLLRHTLNGLFLSEGQLKTQSQN